MPTARTGAPGLPEWLTTDRISPRPLNFTPADETPLTSLLVAHPTIARAWFVGDALRPLPERWLPDNIAVQWHDHRGHNTGQTTDMTQQLWLRGVRRDSDGMIVLFPEVDIQPVNEPCRGCQTPGGCATCGDAPPQGFTCNACGAGSTDPPSSGASYMSYPSSGIITL